MERAHKAPFWLYWGFPEIQMKAKLSYFPFLDPLATHRIPIQGLWICSLAQGSHWKAICCSSRSGWWKKM